MKTVKLCSTDGNLIVPVDEVAYLLQDPEPLNTSILYTGTCMLTMKTGKTFEVSGDLNEVAEKIWGAEQDAG